MTRRIRLRPTLASYYMNSRLFVQKYQLYLLDRETLRRELALGIKQAEA
jgi:adenylylsulfate kinase-like enzyme